MLFEQIPRYFSRRVGLEIRGMTDFPFVIPRILRGLKKVSLSSLDSRGAWSSEIFMKIVLHPLNEVECLKMETSFHDATK